MKARLVVFPIKGRNWCFARSVDQTTTFQSSSDTPSTLKGLLKKLTSDSKPINQNAELVVDFVSNKMNDAWVGLEKAPQGTVKNKIHGVGLKLLSRVKPSENFFKSITKDVSTLHVTYPSSVSPLLVRRRLRHLAISGTVVHKKYLYGSIALLAPAATLAILPLPNVPFFWVLFRTYSHWRAHQGSTQLVQLLSNGPHTQNPDTFTEEGSVKDQEEVSGNDQQDFVNDSQALKLVLQPSEELTQLLRLLVESGGADEGAISDICEKFRLNKVDVLKYRDSM